MVTPDAKREAVAHACKKHCVSQRRACEVLSVDRLSACVTGPFGLMIPTCGKL